MNKYIFYCLCVVIVATMVRLVCSRFVKRYGAVGSVIILNGSSGAGKSSIQREF